MPKLAVSDYKGVAGTQWTLSLKGGLEFTLVEGVRLAPRDILGLEPIDKNVWVAEVLRNPQNPAGFVISPG
jgi:hypothetical protein